MEQVTKNYNSTDRYVIKDVAGAWGNVFIAIFSLVLGFLFFVFSLAMETPTVAVISGVLFLLIAIIQVQKFRINNRGYVIDFGNNQFIYPGGKAADSTGDVLKISWISQLMGLSQGEIRLSDIQRVSYSDDQKWNPDAKRWTTTHLITFEGPFGSITNTFASQGKRDQLMTLMVQNLQMGQPMVMR